MCCYRSRLVFNLLLRHDISQGSVVTHLRCGGIFSNGIVTNFLLILAVNNFVNRLVFDKVKAYKIYATFFGHSVHELSLANAARTI